MKQKDYFTISFIMGMFFIQSIIEDCSELVKGLDWLQPDNPPPTSYYDLKGYRSQMLIEPEHGEIFDLIHKAHIKLMLLKYINTTEILYQQTQYTINTQDTGYVSIQKAVIYLHTQTLMRSWFGNHIIYY